MALIKCHECESSISKAAATCPQCGAAQKKETFWGIWLVLIVAGLWALGDLLSPPSRSQASSVSPTAASSAATKRSAIEKTYVNFSWSKGGFDTIMEATFKIRNDNPVQIKDIEITCTHFGKSGTEIDSSKRVIYDVVPANSVKTFDKFNMGFMHSQSESTACKITDLAY